MHRMPILAAVCLFFGLFSGAAHAETVAFNTPASGTIVLPSIDLGVAMTPTDLHQYLQDPTVAGLTWQFIGSPPSWLSLDKTSGILSGTPTGAGSATTDNFEISVNLTTASGNKGAIGNFQIVVTAAPILSAVNLGTLTVGTSFTGPTPQVTNPLGSGTITFSLSGQPSWMTVNASTGVISGTPSPTSYGTLSGITLTATLVGFGSSTVSVTGTVQVVPPFWSQNPVTLPNANDENTYTQNIASYAVNPEQTPMTFSLVSGPSWVTVSTTGVITANAPVSADGAQSITIAFTTTINGVTYNPSAVFNFTVTHVPRPPVWSENPVVLPPASVGVPYTFNLNTVATNPESGALTFSATGLPSWLTLNPTTGVLSGTPPPNSSGPITGITFTATGAGGPASVPGQGTVNVVPPSWSQNPINLPAANDASAYSQSVASYVVNPEQTAVTFSIVSGPAWASINPSTGVISGSPQKTDDGAATLTVQFSTVISGTTYTPQTVVNITVNHVPKPPAFSENPIILPPATVGVPYTFNLNTVTTDPEGGTLTFSETGLPSWLTLNPSTGVLSGTPPANSFGPITGVTITATSSTSGLSGSAPAQGVVNVVPPSWSGNPITLPDANDAPGNSYSQSVTSYVVNPEQTTVTFSIVTGPSWATINPTTGVISGSPTKANDGANTITVQFTTTVGATVYNPTTVFDVTVDHVKQPPVWSQIPILLPAATVAASYTYNLSPLVTDPEGGTLTFSATGLPSWLTLNPSTGVLSGTPPANSVGAITGVVVTATSTSGLSANDNASGTVNVAVPVWTLTSINLGTATVGTPFTFNLAPYLTNPLGSAGVITYSAIGLPSWLTLNPSTGVLTGTPGVSNIGPYLVTSFTASLQGQGSASVPGSGNVVVAPPFWTANPITLPNANDAAAYSENVSSYAVNPEGTPMTFSIVNGPSWATINPTTAVISGSPQKSNDGPVSMTVQFTTTINGTVYTVSTVFDFNVQHIKQPPVWSQNPVQLPPATVGVAFTYNLAPLVTDPESGTLTFSATGLPSWLSLSSNGVLSGTPTISSVGTFTGVGLTVTSTSGLSAPDTAQGSVQIVYPVWSTNVINLGTQTVGVPFSFNLAPYVTNPLPSAAITWSAVGLPGWLTLNPTTGVLTGTPGAGDIGPYLVTSFTASLAGEGSASASGQGVVIPAVPYWTANPITLPNANDTVLYTQNVASYAVNPEGTPMTFSLVTGPTWATVSAAGVISGTPAVANDGPVSMTVQFTTTINGQVYTVATVFTFMVLHTNQPPVWSQNPVILPPATVGVPYTFNLTTVATDPQGKPLTFSATGLPVWLTISPSGVLSGTPTLSDVGAFSGITFTATGVGGSSSAAGQGSVIVTAPSWTGNPIALPNATNGVSYTQNLVTYVVNPSNIPLTYTQTSGPSWVTISSNGTLSGVPMNTGAVSVGVQFTGTAGGQTYQVSTVFTFNVLAQLLPPAWSSTSINLGTQYVGQAWTFNLNTVVTDPQGGTLTFAATGLPSWMTLNPTTGVLSGTPQTANIGSYTGIVFTATGPGGPSSATGFGQVVQSVYPPKWVANPITIENAVAGTAYNVDLTQYVLNPSALPLTYTILVTPIPPTWTTLNSTTSLLSGTPQTSNLGAVTLSVQLATTVDGQPYTNSTVLQFNVVAPGQPPVWLQNPITMTANVGQPFSNSLAGYASDPKGLTLTFSLVSTPTWLSVASNGALTGTPATANLGTNTFTVQVCNTVQLCATAQLIINVLNSGPQTDTVQVDAPVPGATAENLWIVGNYPRSSDFVSTFEDTFHTYFDDLTAAGIHHSGVMINADGKVGGVPIHKSGQASVFSWSEDSAGSDTNLVADFKGRVSQAYVFGGMSDNSPIWSMYLLYSQLTTMTDIYQNGWFMPSVPMDAMIVTDAGDGYSCFENSATKGWTVAQFAKYFIQVHANEQKPYRVSALVPKCPCSAGAYDEEAENAVQPTAYKQLTDATGGTEYVDDVSDNAFIASMHAYAQSVIFRAYVTAKTVVKLSKKPTDPSTIKVTIGGTTISAPDWSYDATANAVDLRWDLLLTQLSLKPGDNIVITYTASN